MLQACGIIFLIGEQELLMGRLIGCKILGLNLEQFFNFIHVVNTITEISLCIQTYIK